MWNADDYHIEGLFVRGEAKEWEYIAYGFYPRGLGDLIYNTMCYIVEKDMSNDWAKLSLIICSDLLEDRKRWPDAMGTHYTSLDIASGSVQYMISKLYKKLGGEERQLYRPQKSMTRDPYQAFYLCCLHLGRPEYIKEVTIPWYLYTPSTWKWRRRLIKDNSKEFVQRLRYIRAKATVLKYENNRIQ